MWSLMPVLLALAATTAASRQQVPGLGKMSPSKAASMCGTGQSLQCCNKVIHDKGGKDSKDDNDANRGIVGNLLHTVLGDDGLGGLLGDCSPIEVGGIPGANSILDDQCRAKVACCDKQDSVATGGLVNIALPCVALGSIVG